MSCVQALLVLFTLLTLHQRHSNAIKLKETCTETVDTNNKYLPTWASLDTRPLPKWFDDAKIGIFVHWGVFSVPSFGREWFWSDWKKDKQRKVVDFMAKNYPPGFTYQEFAKDFTAEFYNPVEWAELFKKAGANYVVMTSKHQEGFALWPSKYSFSWNAVDVGPHRDLLGDLAKAVRAKKMTFGLFHSLDEWFHPLYLADKQNLYITQDFVQNKIIPEMHELVEKYKPEVFSTYCDREAPDIYWNSTNFLAWLYNESPVRDTVVVNDRWGVGTPYKHGDVYSCSCNKNPGVLQNHKWSNAMGLNRESFGFLRNAKISSYLSNAEVLQTLAMTISGGGNLLVNVAPTKEGVIAPIFQERLLALGEWLGINGNAIYKSKPWTTQNDALTKEVWYTSDLKENVYAIVLDWPQDNVIRLKAATKLFQCENASVVLLGNEKTVLKWGIRYGAVSIILPDKAIVKSKDAWVLKISQ